MKIDKRITIYYFSATGNSLKVAMDIASNYEKSELVKINYEAVSIHPESEVVGFVFPVYMGGVPDIIQQFLHKFPFRQKVYYFAIGTYYTYKGITLSAVNKIFADRDAVLNYGNYVQTVGNCLMEYEVPDKKRPAILKRAEATTKIIIDDIIHQKEKAPSRYCHPSVRFHKWTFNLFFKETYKKFSLEDNCTGCGACAKVCPVNNIHIQNKRPQWGENCIACHACVHWCGQNAINIGRSKGRLQYHNPGVKVRMLFR